MQARGSPGMRLACTLGRGCAPFPSPSPLPQGAPDSFLFSASGHGHTSVCCCSSSEPARLAAPLADRWFPAGTAHCLRCPPSSWTWCPCRPARPSHASVIWRHTWTLTASTVSTAGAPPGAPHGRGLPSGSSGARLRAWSQGRRGQRHGEGGQRPCAHCLRWGSLVRGSCKIRSGAVSMEPGVKRPATRGWCTRLRVRVAIPRALLVLR